MVYQVIFDGLQYQKLLRYLEKEWRLVYSYLIYHILTEMNREIASAPEKSEADFCARRTAALSRPQHQTVHTPPD